MGKFKKKAFITGIFGQDGAYLAKLLLEKGYYVVGGSRRSSLDYTYRLRALGIENKIEIINFDLTDEFNVASAVIDGQFDEIYNLGAQSFVGASWDLPIQTSRVDAMGPLYLLDAIKRFSKKTKFYQASTSEMFGSIREPIQNEDTPFYPRSPYGVAKLFAHSMTVNYRESFDIFATSGILFNHESELRGDEFVTKKITRQLAEIKLGIREKLSLGNLDAERDWGYAPEYVRGMWLMMQHQVADNFVLATGKKSSVRDFVRAAAQALDIDIKFENHHEDEIGVDCSSGKTIVDVHPQYYRPAEVGVLLGNPKKAKQKLGWKAEANVSDIAKIMSEYDYNFIKKNL